MFIISKQFHFSASHTIEGLPEDHPCGRLHGHNYIVELVFAAEKLNSVGFVVDFGELKPFKKIIDDELDHRHLNDVLDCPTTSENIALYLYNRVKDIWPQIRSVRVSETPKVWAEYLP